MQVRPITGNPRPRFRFWRRLVLAVLRWSFIVLGALTAASVLFTHIYSVNETIYDPSSFAIGVARPVLDDVRRHADGAVAQQPPARRTARAKLRCEELADFTWELKEAEARAVSLLESQGDLIVRRDSEGRITYANDAFCTLAGQPREALLGTTGRAHGDRAWRGHGADATAHASTTSKIDDSGRTALARLARNRGLGRHERHRRGAERRPRRHRAHRNRTRAGGGARRRRGGKPRQVALSGDGVARNPHAAERHPRHDAVLSWTRTLTAEQTAYLKATKTSGEALLCADRGHSRFLQDRSRHGSSWKPSRSR